jgi:vacuolar protein sorting-associated protein 45
VREKLMHRKAVYFVRPTKDNIQLLKHEIATSHFKEYHLFFTNEIPEPLITELAEADISDRIKNIPGLLCSRQEHIFFEDSVNSGAV